MKGSPVVLIVALCLCVRGQARSSISEENELPRYRRNNLQNIDNLIIGLHKVDASGQSGLESRVLRKRSEDNFHINVDNTRESRQTSLSLLHQGVYVPDERFNAFVDGVMVNMVAEMKRRRMDPLYFRVYDRGIIEHVPTRGKRDVGDNDEVEDDGSSARQPRQSPSSALGGGVVTGLTNIKRFGNAEVQVAGNTTLIRSHWLTGPLDVIIDYSGRPTITRARTGMQAVQFDTLSVVDRFGSEMKEFELLSPLFEYMSYYGNRTLAQQQTTELVVKHLFSNASFMALLLRDSFEVASFDKIIPQFGADDNYYSVLQYLFSGGKRNRGKRNTNGSKRQISDINRKKLTSFHP